MQSDYERLGGEEGVRRLVSAYVDRFFDDFIIGYLFQGKDRDRIVEHETQLACQHLGGPQRYHGRPLKEAHQPLKINQGHFRRRLAILRHVLAEQGAPQEVVERWVGFEQNLEAVITTGRDCLE